MAAVFVIYIPTPEHERKLENRKSDREKSQEKLAATAAATVTSVTAAATLALSSNNVSSTPKKGGGGTVHTSPSTVKFEGWSPAPLIASSKNDVIIDSLKEQKLNGNNDNNQSTFPLNKPGSLNNLSSDNGGAALGLLTASKISFNDKNQIDVEKCMESELKVGLEKLKIEDAVWKKSRNGKFHQITFPCESQERCEEILEQLYYNGIGRLKESSVSVLPCSVRYAEDDESDFYSEEEHDSPKEKEIASVKSQFLKSIKARLTVAQVVETVRSGATLTFDFVAFLILASLIAGFGLMDSSSVSIVASMLVSPLMGPIMALSFAAVIRDKDLFFLGVRSELFGLGTVITIGFILGLINSPWSIKWGKGPWPTPEMLGRGQTRALWVGALVALPSGAGVALSILGGNASSLVGVAISASLLPPCVNAGILWANAVVLILTAIGQTPTTIEYGYTNITNKPALLPVSGYNCEYSTNMAYESATLGVISMCLTLVNIACIIIMAIVVLLIKQVAPTDSMPATSRFWKEDIKIAREYNTVHHVDNTNLRETFLHEWAEKMSNMSPNATQQSDNFNNLQDIEDIVQEAEEDEVYQTVMKCTAHQMTLPQRASMRKRASDAGISEGKTAVWDAFQSPRQFRGSSRRRSRRLTLVEARNRRCNSVFGQEMSLQRLQGGSIHHPSPSSRFQVTRAEDSHHINFRRPSLTQVPEDDSIL